MAFEHLRGHRTCLLTTHRKSGDAVATPVWFVADDDALLICTDDPSGKVRRIRADRRVTVAPCTLRGKRLGPDRPAVASLLQGAEAAEAERVMRSRYTITQKLFYAVVHPLVTRGKSMAFLRVEPQ